MSLTGWKKRMLLELPHTMASPMRSERAEALWIVPVKDAYAVVAIRKGAPRAVVAYCHELDLRNIHYQPAAVRTEAKRLTPRTSYLELTPNDASHAFYVMNSQAVTEVVVTQ